MIYCGISIRVLILMSVFWMEILKNGFQLQNTIIRHYRFELLGYPLIDKF